MPPDKPHIIWKQGDHPSLELLEQYHEGTLPDALHHQLERHLLDCDLCSDALEGLAVSAAIQTEHDVRDINRHIAAQNRRQQGKTIPLYLSDWKVAAAVVLVLLSSVAVFYYNYQQVSERQGIATQQDQAIKDAMDLGKKPTAAAIPESVADAKPDTLRPSHIAANAMPVPLRAPRSRVNMPKMDEEDAIISDLQIDQLTELNERETERSAQLLLESIPARPPVEEVRKLAEVTVPAAPQRLSLQPESSSVAKALQGKVAGVQVQRNDELTPNQVQGQVVDQEGNPLPGVSVVVKGTSQGVATDAAGNFTLTLPDDKATLVFRFIGYETREKSIAANTGPITMDLQVDNRSLSEVVVTGYGTGSSRPAPAVSAKPAAGNNAYRKYLEENLRYTPDMPKGRVVVRATVATSGSLENLEVVRSLCESCDSEAMRLLAQGPKWRPATKDGQKVEQQVRIVVRFKPGKAN